MLAAVQGQMARDLVELLFDGAFNRPSRDPRSAEYKAGVRAILAWRVHGVPMPRPYPMGTVQADAFYSGADEGHQLWRAYEDLEKRRAAQPSPVPAKN